MYPITHSPEIMYRKLIPNVWITKDKDGSYRLTDSEENKWYFDKEGVLYQKRRYEWAGDQL